MVYKLQNPKSKFFWVLDFVFCTSSIVVVVKTGKSSSVSFLNISIVVDSIFQNDIYKSHLNLEIFWHHP